MTYSKTPKKKNERLTRDRDKINCSDFGFERRRVVEFWEARRR